MRKVKGYTILIIILLSSCATNKFNKQKFTNLKQPKVEFKEETNPATDSPEVVEFDESTFETPPKTEYVYETISNNPMEIEDLELQENNDIPKTEKSTYKNQLEGAQTYNTSIKGVVEEEKGDNFFFQFWFWLCLILFLFAVTFMVIGFVIFFSALSAGTLAASSSAIFFYLTIAGLVFGSFYLLNMLGVELWIFGTLSYYFGLLTIGLPLLALAVFIIWELIFG